MVANYAMTDAIPLMADDGLTGRNTARDIRTGLLASLFNTRPGVLADTWDPTHGWTSLQVTASTPEDTSCVVAPGHALINRPGQGPYIAWLEHPAILTLDPADPTNPRIDVV